MIFKGSRYEYSTVDFFSPKTTKSEQPVIFYTFSTLGDLVIGSINMCRASALTKLQLSTTKTQSLGGLSLSTTLKL
jgi:hypothetical protein